MGKLMKEEMEKHNGKSDDELRAIMVPKYNTFLKQVLQRYPTMGGLSACQKTEVKLKDRKPTRRRSFGQEPKKKAVGMSESQSAAAIDAAVAACEGSEPEAPQIDSWDSVSDQPYCPVCSMGFKTPAALQRHVNYSDLHLKQVEKLEKEGKALAPGASPLRKDKGTAKPVQEEGTHYRLLYSGAKLFWRTSTNIDFDIYLHVISNCVEIIGHDGNLGKELNRIYVDYRLLLMNVEQTVLESIANKRKEATKDKFAKVASSEAFEEVMLEEARQLACVSFLLGRVQLDSATNTLSMSINATDAANIAPTLAQPPVTLIPINVNRRRKTSTEEITQTIAGLQTDYADLRAATEKAEKVSSLVFESASMLTSLASKKDNSGNRWAKLWRWAIRITIRQKHVKLMTVEIKKWEERQAAKKEAEKKEADLLIEKLGAPIAGAAGSNSTGKPNNRSSAKVSRRSYGEVSTKSRK
jgi:hypothetical protein